MFRHSGNKVTRCSIDRTAIRKHFRYIGIELYNRFRIYPLMTNSIGACNRNNCSTGKSLFVMGFFTLTKIVIGFHFFSKLSSALKSSHSKCARYSSIRSDLPLQYIHLRHIDRFFISEESDNYCQPYGCFSGGDGHNEEDQDLACLVA